MIEIWSKLGRDKFPLYPYVPAASVYSIAASSCQAAAAAML